MLCIKSFGRYYYSACVQICVIENRIYTDNATYSGSYCHIKQRYVIKERCIVSIKVVYANIKRRKPSRVTVI